MEDRESSLAYLKSALYEYDLQFDNKQLSKLLDYQEILLDKNRQLNLTRIDSWDESLDLNLIDSLLMYKEFSDTEGMFLDIGTGAGLPGIPLAIVSGRTGVLMDSVKKKIAAVEGFIDELDLKSQLVTTDERAETYAKHHKAYFGCVVARAVAQTEVLLEYARPMLESTGSVVLTKGRLSIDEMNNAEIAADKFGYRIVSRETFELPHNAGHREIIRFEVYKPTSIKLPREVGVAKKKPISSLVH
jgi:16S rRNA (guanine527-N7)-methyltransferase